MKRKSYIYKYCRCRALKENPKNNYCNNCRKLYYQNSKKKQTPLNKEIMEFVVLIESRGGWCSLSDLLVTLITFYYSIITKDEISDSLPPNKQLEMMYAKLKDFCGIN